MALTDWLNDALFTSALPNKRPRRRRTSRQRFGMESLEARQLLSADALLLNDPSADVQDATTDSTVDLPDAAAASGQSSENSTRGANSGSFTGTVQAVEDDNEIRVQNTVGKSETFKFDENTKVVDDKGNEIQDIKTIDGRQVTVEWEKKGTKQLAKKITVHRSSVSPIDPPAGGGISAEGQSFENQTRDANSGTFVGTVQAVEKDNEIRVENTQGTTETFTFDSNTQVVDEQGNAVDIKTTDGRRVKVEWTKDGTKQYAETITVLSSSVSSIDPPSGGNVGGGEFATVSSSNSETHANETNRDQPLRNVTVRRARLTALARRLRQSADRPDSIVDAIRNHDPALVDAVFAKLHTLL